MAQLATRLSSMTLDRGSEYFEPSTLALTSIDTNNAAKNVIPETCRCAANIRFNDCHSSASLEKLLAAEMQLVAKRTGIEFSFGIEVAGESFIVPPGPLARMVADAIEKETGIRPEFSTGGGTSDARFIKNHCPVIEFGLVGKTMHQSQRMRVGRRDLPIEIDLRANPEKFFKLNIEWHRGLSFLPRSQGRERRRLVWLEMPES